MPNQLNNTLIDIRNAYRLLFEYQDRIRNLVLFIGGHLDFDFSEGNSLFSNTISKGSKVNLNSWSWDWLPMYFYQFKFAKKNDLTFSIFILTDSGFFDANNRSEQSSNKLKPDTFNTAANSKSQLFFVIGKDMWRDELKTTRCHEILFQENKIFQNDKNGKLLIKEFNLDQFLDENRAISTLENFQMFCNQNGIGLKLKQRELE